MTVGIQSVMAENLSEKIQNQNKVNNVPTRSGNRKLTKNDDDAKNRKNERNLTKFITP